MSYKDHYNDYINSDHWENLRKYKLAKSGRRCFNCGTAQRLHVHHINYRNLTDCTIDDLVVLCCVCHDALHAYLSRMNLRAHDAAARDIRRILQIEFGGWQKKQKRHKVRKPKQEQPEIVSGETVVLTKELIKLCRTRWNGFTKATIKALGVTQLKAGWPKRLVGKTIPKSSYNLALEGKLIRVSKRNPKYTFAPAAFL